MSFLSINTWESAWISLRPIFLIYKVEIKNRLGNMDPFQNWARWFGDDGWSAWPKLALCLVLPDTFEGARTWLVSGLQDHGKDTQPPVAGRGHVWVWSGPCAPWTQPSRPRECRTALGSALELPQCSGCSGHFTVSSFLAPRRGVLVRWFVWVHLCPEDFVSQLRDFRESRRQLTAGLPHPEARTPSTGSGGSGGSGLVLSAWEFDS